MAKKKRANGEGSVWQRPNGTWVAQVSFTDPATGKPDRKAVSGKTKQEVLKKKRKLETAKDINRLVSNDKITLGQWIDRWLEVYKKPALKYSTWYSYKQLADLHIIPALGDKQLDRLQAAEIQAFYNKLSESGRIDMGKQTEGKPPGLSPRTVRLCHVVISGALRQAVKEGLVMWNAAESTEPPKQEKKEITPLTTEQVVFFLDAIKDHELFPIIFVDLGTGLRRGELLNLTWSNTDLVKKTALIKQSLVQVGGKIYPQEDVKTAASRATIKLPNEVVQVLKGVKKDQAAYKLKLGEAYQDNDLVFCREDGLPFRPDTVYHQYKDLLKEHGMPDVSFHALRHTFCTMLLEHGEELFTVSKLARHSGVAITADTYGHLTDTMKDQAAEKLDAILAPKKQKKAGCNTVATND